MVSGDPSRPSARADSDEPFDDGVDDATYDLIYRATRDAIWDVVGTATLILFYLALSAIGLSIAVGGVGQSLRGPAPSGALVVGAAGLGIGLFAALRTYRLVTE
ncbi:hypothetical protein [Halobellus ordinarius]|uniref:hypothetical protein n=1 Tax=Halobellus ordinarius TaxID=3075120 RepID=UPI0028802C87|nr:hypothetical protein [Halobellus sp. ZY16]